jgi:hypothetical protein
LAVPLVSTCRTGGALRVSRVLPQSSSAEQHAPWSFGATRSPSTHTPQTRRESAPQSSQTPPAPRRIRGGMRAKRLAACAPGTQPAACPSAAR